MDNKCEITYVTLLADNNIFYINIFVQFYVSILNYFHYLFVKISLLLPLFEKNMKANLKVEPTSDIYPILNIFSIKLCSCCQLQIPQTL